MEFVGRVPNEIFGTIHGPGYSGGASFGGTHDFGVPVSDDFHTFAIEWQPDRIDWYRRRHPLPQRHAGDVAPNQWVFNHPFFLILNMAVGGNFGGPARSQRHVPAVHAGRLRACLSGTGYGGAIRDDLRRRHAAGGRRSRCRSPSFTRSALAAERRAQRRADAVAGLGLRPRAAAGRPRERQSAVGQGEADPAARAHRHQHESERSGLAESRGRDHRQRRHDRLRAGACRPNYHRGAGTPVHRQRQVRDHRCRGGAGPHAERRRRRARVHRRGRRRGDAAPPHHHERLRFRPRRRHPQQRHAESRALRGHRQRRRRQSPTTSGRAAAASTAAATARSTCSTAP